MEVYAAYFKEVWDDAQKVGLSLVMIISFLVGVSTIYHSIIPSGENVSVDTNGR